MVQTETTKTVDLGNGRFALVDAEDFARVSKHKWHAHSSRGLWYARRSFREGRLVRKQYMHHLIFGQTHSRVDHINGNPLDNRRANLRESSATQNQGNMTVSRKNNTSGFKGLGLRGGGRWAAICKKQYGGTYLHRFDAAIAYDCMALCEWGSYAKTNHDPMRYAVSSDMHDMLARGFI